MKQEKILIVEDEPAIGLDIMLNLERHGYEVVAIANDADYAFEVLEQERVDLAILDINLEGEKSGIDVAQVIDRDYGIPFIFLTSYSDKNTIAKAAETFPAGYLVKPFRTNDLAPAVRVALTCKTAKATHRLPSLALLNKDRVQPITAGEYRVLEHLWDGASNSKTSSMLHISVNTVKSHIRNIYAKLDVHSKADLINYLSEL